MDIDPNKIHMARHNAEIYGVAHKIKFIVGNFFTVYKKLRYLMPDVIVTSPPWGGPEYLATNIYSLKSLCNNNSGGGFRIFNLAKTIAPNIALHIPRTTNIHEVRDIKCSIYIYIYKNSLSNKHYFYHCIYFLVCIFSI